MEAAIALPPPSNRPLKAALGRPALRRRVPSTVELHEAPGRAPAAETVNVAAVDFEAQPPLTLAPA